MMKNGKERRGLAAAHYGALAADALAMPAHWYYDRVALRRDYGELRTYAAPRPTHPDSILWRSHYTPVNERGDILGPEAAFWGQRGVHYHRQLQAGENTLNFKLAHQLYHQCRQHGGYDPDRWLQTYIELMLTPSWHRDTYVEECHRGFFQNYAQGQRPDRCGIADIHIGGLAMVPALFSALAAHLDLERLLTVTRQHVGHTHRHPRTLLAASTLVKILWAVREGEPLHAALVRLGNDWVSERRMTEWAAWPDDVVIGQKVSPACYIDEAMPAALYLTWKYADDFTAGIRANALVGGDNCHRGSVVGSLLGLSLGLPAAWIQPGQATADFLTETPDDFATVE